MPAEAREDAYAGPLIGLVPCRPARVGLAAADHRALQLEHRAVQQELPVEGPRAAAPGASESLPVIVLGDGGLVVLSIT